MKDRGKEFEQCTKAALLAEGACVDRLPDQMTGLAGSTNPCDFIAYRHPYDFFIECKSCSVETQLFDIRGYISEYQWIALLNKSKFEGVFSGYLIWFVHNEKIVWVPAPKMESLYKIKRSCTAEELLEVGSNIRFKTTRGKPKFISLLDDIESSGDNITRCLQAPK